jgi:NAD(P)-dependent dehydrogenase (short-subunit alcohol dehydrogenase family)
MTKGIALITGASRGIGKQVAIRLLKIGYIVIATCYNKNKIQLLEQEFTALGFKDFLVKALDVRNSDDVVRLRKEIEIKYNSIDILINNAGVMDKNPGKIATQLLDDWDDTLNINVRGPFIVCKEMLQLVKNSHQKKILNISGGLGTFSSGMKGGTHCAYRVSKAALNALTLTLSEELIADGISVISIDPGWVRTDLGGSDAPKSAEQAAKEIVDTIEGAKKTGVFIRELQTMEW